jgi:hypothetical protein
MLSAAEIRNFTWLNGEARHAVTQAFNAVSQWRDEISHANDRYLSNVLDQVAVAQRAQGWPNSVTVATRQHLLQASKEMMRLGEMTLTPFKIWLNAAEAWQRSWAEALGASTDTQPGPAIKKAA